MAKTYPNRWRTRGDLSLGRWLAAARITRSITQAELADTLTASTGVTWSQDRVSNYETARSPLTVSQLVQVVYALGMESPWSVVAELYADDVAGSPAWRSPVLELTPAGYPLERVVK